MITITIVVQLDALPGDRLSICVAGEGDGALTGHTQEECEPLVRRFADVVAGALKAHLGKVQGLSLLDEGVFSPRDSH